MSLGYIGYCTLEIEDACSFVYIYSGRNWNLPKDEADALEADEGFFTIRKDALEEPEIHSKVVRSPGARRTRWTKIVPHFPNIGQHLDDGGIVIDELCGVDKRESGETGTRLPRIVHNLLVSIFVRYMIDGKVPDRESFIQ